MDLTKQSYDNFFEMLVKRAERKSARCLEGATIGAVTPRIGGTEPRKGPPSEFGISNKRESGMDHHDVLHFENAVRMSWGRPKNKTNYIHSW